MYKKTFFKIIVTSLLALIIIISSNIVFAKQEIADTINGGTGTTNSGGTITPKNISGSKIEIKELDFLDNVTNLVRLVGTFIAVGVLMVIGIRYVMGSVEEKASYKKSMLPYIIGCFLLFGASYIAPNVKELFTNIGDSTENIGNSILGLIRAIGTFISIGALMVMGIRYMMGSVEERASYKKSMIPYVIGVIILFAAVNITSFIYNAVPTAKGRAESYFRKTLNEYGEDSTQKVTSAIQQEMKKTEDDEYKDELSKLLYEYSQEHMGE